ncbi:40S ribosomal protein S4 [Porphyridium purpureum]|uniref:40S ribosomal protein S4 n=1 Tax=Porphyridium purpureum TaxID=35688 RepID=A0A5J4YM28_PORPP|nr:40S ribosomal protein S4 [Porphyridium purpureum]|eukprot:POR1398..scf295_9
MGRRGPKKHLKRLAAPNHWMLDKLTGVWAPKPSSGPHKTRECLPLMIILRNRLKYALNGREVMQIVMQRLVKVDGKVRTDRCYPAGFMDVVSLEKTNEIFRLLYDVKGRFVLHRIGAEEAKYKLCKVTRQEKGPRGIPYIATHDSRTIRFPDPLIKVADSVRVDIETGKIIDFIKFEVGNLCMTTAGHNQGRVGTIMGTEKHPGSFEMIKIQDAAGHVFVTRKSNVFVIGKGAQPIVSLPKDKGIKKSVISVQEEKYGVKQAV